MKYIIKNCPVNYGLYKEMCGFTEKPEDIGKTCADCTDCLLKQIAERCKARSEKFFSFLFAQEILNLLEIEEVNE